MAKVGLVLNRLGALVIATAIYTLGTSVFHIDPGVVPDWAETMTGGAGGM